MKTMQHHNGIAFSVQGTGEPLLLLHCGFVADAMQPLFDAPVLRDYRRINYHRRGYGSSAPVTPPYSMEQQVDDALALLDALQVERAHLVGHSMGGCVALQLALTAPDRVHSLALLEPPLTFAMSAHSLETFGAVAGSAVNQLLSGDAAGGVNTWLTGAFGPGFQPILEQAIPGATQQMVQDGATAMLVEGDALQNWQVSPADISNLRPPVLSVLHIDPYLNLFQEVHTALTQWLPGCESLVIPNTTHLLQIAQPRAVAEGLAAFLERQRVMA